jgi:leucyl-tRNA synthetase
MSMGPLDASRPWETRAVVGSHRFLQRVWRNIVDEETGASRVTDEPADETTRRLLHRTIERVSSDMDGLHFNTAIARLIELNNHVVKSGTTPREVAEPLVLMLSPLAPHLAEELWTRLGHENTLAYEPFPVADPALLIEESVTCVIQVGGKVRDRIAVPPSIATTTCRNGRWRPRLCSERWTVEASGPSSSARHASSTSSLPDAERTVPVPHAHHRRRDRHRLDVLPARSRRAHADLTSASG